MSFPLLLLFGLGYVLSRIAVRVDAHVLLLGTIAHRAQGSTARLCLGIMAITFGLSLCFSNLLTVVALLPLVQRAVDAMALEESARKRLTTFLALGVIYAANIGGMGSLIGSPANGLLLGALSFYEVPGRDAITFWSWLAFGLPVASILLVLSWGILVATLGRRVQSIARPFPIQAVEHPRDYRRGLWVCIAAITACMVSAVLADTMRPDSGDNPLPQGVFDWIMLALALAFVGGTFWIRLPERNERLLRWRDLMGGLPLRGVLIALLASGVGALMFALGALDALQTWMVEVLPTTWSHNTTLWAVVFVTIFATEVVSNTAAAVAMWVVVISLAEATGGSALFLMIAVGMASTAAFMSPLATPATGMVFGGLRGVSLRPMLAVGLLVNMVAALWISLSLCEWVPWILSP